MLLVMRISSIPFKDFKNHFVNDLHVFSVEKVLHFGRIFRISSNLKVRKERRENYVNECRTLNMI